jgi:hypothetical protein
LVFQCKIEVTNSVTNMLYFKWMWSCSSCGTRRVNLVTNHVISHEWWKDREVITTNGTYPWSFVTQIFHKISGNRNSYKSQVRDNVLRRWPYTIASSEERHNNIHKQISNEIKHYSLCKHVIRRNKTKWDNELYEEIVIDLYYYNMNCNIVL